jgi:ComF family protein
LVPRIRGRICRRCGLPLSRKNKKLTACPACDKNISELQSLRAYGLYEGALEKLIGQFKLRFDLKLTDHLAKTLSKVYRVNFGKEKNHDCLVTIPHHRFTLVRRGFDPLYNLGCALSFRLQIPYRSEALFKSKWTRPQHAYSLAKRKVNIGSSSFVVNRRENLDGARILLVDDVVTSGTTLNACAERLRASYKDVVVDGLALAMTRLDRG